MHRWVSYEIAQEDLAALDPAQRLLTLLVEYRTSGQSLSTEDLRRLFVYAWGNGDFQLDGEQERRVITLLRWIAPVRDVESYLVGTHIIYRPAEGSEDGIRWTLDESVARQEAGGEIVQGEVESNEVLAHLMADGKNHVVVDPEDIYDVRPV